MPGEKLARQHRALHLIAALARRHQVARIVRAPAREGVDVIEGRELES
jgi:hypothetical protein